MDGWTAETDQRLDAIHAQFDKADDQHSAAESAGDLTALSAVCDDYRVILDEIDELTKPLE